MQKWNDIAIKFTSECVLLARSASSSVTKSSTWTVPLSAEWNDWVFCLLNTTARSIRLEGMDVNLDETTRESISWRRKFKCMEGHPSCPRSTTPDNLP